MLGKKAGGLILLSVALTSTAFADCAVLTPEQAERIFAQEAGNIFFKGLLIGLSISLLIANLLRLYFRCNWVSLALLLLFLLPTFFLISVGEMMAYCGHAGISATCYLVPMLALLLFLALQSIWKPESKSVKLR